MQGFLLINKPKGITSFGVAARIRHLTGEKRVGHSGTLDPLATGVLGIFIGKATSLSSYLLDSDKEYIAKIKLGVATDTEDITGNIIKTASVCADNEQIKAVLKEFIGESLQVPPMYSALKKDGVPLYKLAREGKQVELKARSINIFDIVFLSWLDSDNCFEIKVKCSKGTYIRSLCRDVGERLGCFATLCELKRTATAGFLLEDCIELDQLDSENIKEYIKPCYTAVAHLPEITVTQKQAVRFSNGGELFLDRLNIGKIADGTVFRVNYGTTFLGLGEICSSKGILKVKTVISRIT